MYEAYKSSIYILITFCNVLATKGKKTFVMEG